jgi:hypothetical protein
MRNPAIRQIVVLTAAVLVGFLADGAQGQVNVVPIGSGVEAVCGSQSDAYQNSDPPAIVFGPAGYGSYTPGLVLPNAPAAPAGGSLTLPGNAFAGGGYGSSFIDGQHTTAYSQIDDHVASAPTLLSDVSIGAGFSGMPLLSLNQSSIATGYAYDQLTFGSNYIVYNGSLGPSTANLPLFIDGSVQPGGGNYAQFDGLVDYWWTPVTYTPGQTTFIVNGTPQYLGDVTYTFTQNGGGTFNQTLNSLTNLSATTFGDGILSLDGHMWVAGDPSSITVSAVPEPSTFVLLAAGALCLLACAWRKRRQAA